MENLKTSMNVRKELVDIADEQDRNYWAARLGVSCEKLKSAIKTIQSMEFSRLKEYICMEKIKSSSSYQYFTKAE